MKSRKTIKIPAKLVPSILATLKTTGHFFVAEFVKRTNHEYRIMLCRGGVQKGVKGKGLKYNPEEKNLIIVYDMRKRAFRTIPYEGVRKIKYGGIEWVVDVKKGGQNDNKN